MSTYNEPWSSEDYVAWDADWLRVLRSDETTTDCLARAVVCVNACAGMADPASEIAALRQQLAAAVAGNEHLATKCDLLHEERDQLAAQLAELAPIKVGDLATHAYLAATFPTHADIWLEYRGVVVDVQHSYTISYPLSTQPLVPARADQIVLLPRIEETADAS